MGTNYKPMAEFNLDRIKKGDLTAFRPFFEHYTIMLRRFALKYVQDEDCAKDIVQDVLIRFWERRSRFSNMYSATSFLFISTKNALLDELRHRKVVTESQRKILLQLGTDKDELQQDYIRLYEADTVRSVYQRLENEISQLPERTREVVRLQLAGYKNSEIANLLDIGKESVKTLKRYGLEKLRTSMGDLGEIWRSNNSDFTS